MSANKRTIVFIHSSNEMYGADRILLQVIDTLPVQERAAAILWLPDDVSSAIFSLDAELAKRGVHFEIRTLPILRRKYLAPRYIPRTFMALMRCCRDLRQLSPQAVYLTTSASIPMAIASRLLGINRVVLHCQEVWHGREAYVLAMLATAATHCLCISEATRTSLRGPVKNKAILMLNAVPDCKRRTVPIPSEFKLTFLIASRWNSWKGHRTLLTAWDAGAPLGTLILAGGPPELGKSVDIHEVVAGMTNRESVVIVGEVPDISVLIDSADFVVVPSDKPEPFGLVAIEAFARGRAVIGSNGGGLAEIIDDGRTGRVFPLRDAAALRSLMETLDRDQAIAMGSAARESYLRSYSMDAFNERFQTFWNEILVLPSAEASNGK